jgi:hypothetical protein
MFALCGRLCHPNFKLAKLSRRLSNFNNIQISEEVRAALQDDNAVVALESTIITHGMPYPQNVKCALEVEAVVRAQVGYHTDISISRWTQMQLYWEFPVPGQNLFLEIENKVIYILRLFS